MCGAASPLRRRPHGAGGNGTDWTPERPATDSEVSGSYSGRRDLGIISDHAGLQGIGGRRIAAGLAWDRRQALRSYAVEIERVGVQSSAPYWWDRCGGGSVRTPAKLRGEKVHGEGSVISGARAGDRRRAARANTRESLRGIASHEFAGRKFVNVRRTAGVWLLISPNR